MQFDKTLKKYLTAESIDKHNMPDGKDRIFKKPDEEKINYIKPAEKMQLNGPCQKLLCQWRQRL